MDQVAVATVAVMANKVAMEWAVDTAVTAAVAAITLVAVAAVALPEYKAFLTKWGLLDPSLIIKVSS